MTKKQIIFVHSAGPQGYNEGSARLFAYLQRELGIEYDLHCPAMPEPENPRYQAWRGALQNIFKKVRGEVILVGHSLGASVLLKYISEDGCDQPIRAMMLVATPFWGTAHWQIKEFVLEKDFAEKLPVITRIGLYHSRDDKWVPFSHMTLYSKRMPHAIPHPLEGQAHEFTDGLPELVADIHALR